MKQLLRLLVSVIISITIISCSKKDDDDDTKGTVKLQMSNSSMLLASYNQVTTFACPGGFSCISPTKFEMKILAAYVVEDVDLNTQNNVGQVGMVWLNPACSSINNCTPSMVDYSDLTDPGAFNTLLNSQALAISTGTYKYVRLEFCQGSADSENVRVTGAAVKEFTYGGCGVTSVALSNPITLEEGQSITVNVDYNLNDGEVYYASGGDCPSATDFCLGGIDLSPSLVQ